MTKTKSTILAIGAAGKFASLVVPELAKRGARERRVEKKEDLWGRGVFLSFLYCCVVANESRREGIPSEVWMRHSFPNRSNCDCKS